MLTQAQNEIIERQLGRKPRGIACIAHQTAAGVPTVLQMRSLVERRPFPTLYWLCSRDLYRAIAEIETSGWVKQIERELQQDEALREAYRKNHEDYVALRWQLMDPGDRDCIERLGFTHLFDQYGIGGISQWDKVRCLHMQYAHHLCGDNVIGQRMDAEFGLDKLGITL
ncbi:hypothetical protein GCM10011348_08110 [Marinobacterium nitratireducens]|uniref:DUF501 domain-containing protein n=1 Tax=Marinobacterium nitratireducens TaxID=518897 RepID=A0A918DQS9_9GAMM|nr:DUF501 domain-containing protein [Marinobacterium nitratireducens]GGO77778.1 hypothetical protein GCM10011348_08110 [Marinobacterium nitratireducens]